MTVLDCDGLYIEYGVLNNFIINFAPIGKLKALNLRYARLESLPESIGELTSLIKFSCSNNYLKYLPESIGNLVNLEKFWCYSNNLVNLPESIGKLMSLQIFCYHDNNLGCLPSSMGYLPRDLSFGESYLRVHDKYSPEFTRYFNKYYQE